MSSKSSIPSSFLDWLKPPRAEALARLRINSLGLFALAVLIHLLPLPSLWTALSVVRGNTPVNPLYYGLCAIQLLVALLFSLNVIQASYALKYPRAVQRPPPSPAKPIAVSPPPPQWRLSGLSPKSTPQRQKSFSYVASPVSTPSRTINYSIPDTSLDSSFASSTTSVPPSPSSPLAAYRGRHTPGAGRAFDGLLLSRLTKEAELEDEDDDEDEDE